MTAAGPAAVGQSIDLGNDLLALSARAGGLRPGAASSANALRQRLLHAGVALNGHPAPRPTAQRVELAPSAAAVLALAGTDAGITHLRAWASFVQFTRAMAAAGGERLDRAAFFGAARRAEIRRAFVALSLPGAPAPLLVPVLDLDAYTWPHLDPRDPRPALQAAFDVGPLWQQLPPSPDHARFLGQMAVALLRLIERSQPPVAKRLVLSCAAMDLHRAAGLPSVPRELWVHRLGDMPPAVRHRIEAPVPERGQDVPDVCRQEGTTEVPATQSATPKVTPAALTPRPPSPATAPPADPGASSCTLPEKSATSSSSGRPAPSPATGASTPYPAHTSPAQLAAPPAQHAPAPQPAPNKAPSYARVAARTPAAAAPAPEPVAPASPGALSPKTNTVPATPAAYFTPGSAGYTSANSATYQPLSAAALTVALEALPARMHGPAAGASAGRNAKSGANSRGENKAGANAGPHAASATNSTRSGRVSGAASTPTPRGDDVPPSPQAFTSATPPHKRADAALPAAGPARAAGGASLPDAPTPVLPTAQQQAQDRLQAEVQSIFASSTAEAWSLLAASARSLAPQLPEAAQLHMLASPPATALPAALVPVVELWMRRLASQPARAGAFLAQHEPALRRWASQRPLLRELGRLLASWPHDELRIPAIQHWLIAACGHDAAAPLVQTLREISLSHAVYDEALAYLLYTADVLPAETVAAVVGVTGEKLNNKSGVGDGVRHNTERGLAKIAQAVPTATKSLDPTKLPTWRVLSHCTGNARTVGLQLALAPALQEGANGTDPVATLELLSKAAAPGLQVAAASKLLTRHPQNVALATAVAATLLRHKKLALATRRDPEVLLDAASVRALIEVSNTAGQVWQGSARTAAEVVWQGLEQIAFAVPHFLACGLYDDAASIMHRAHGHPHLSARSLLGLAHQVPAQQVDLLAAALNNAIGVDVLRSHNTLSVLAHRGRAARLQSQRLADAHALQIVRAHLDRCVEGDRAWAATAITQSLLRWSDATTSLDELVHDHNAPAPQLEQLLNRVAWRQLHSPWRQAERPMRRLTELMRADSVRRERIAQYLFTSLQRSTSEPDARHPLWTDICQSLPMLQAVLAATPAGKARQLQADRFSAALGLWPVVRHDAGLVTRNKVTEDWLPARAEAAYALLPYALGLDAPAQDAFVHPLELNRRRARLEATIVHVLRGPEHWGWRTADLLVQVAATGALPTPDLCATVRSGVRIVSAERLAGRELMDRTQPIALAIDTARAVGQAEAPGAQLALATLDGALDSIDAGDHPAHDYMVVHKMLSAQPSAQNGVPGEGRSGQVLEALQARQVERMVAAKATVSDTQGLSGLVGDVALSEEATLSLSLGLHTWLERAEAAPQLAAAYRTLATTYSGRPDAGLLDGRCIRAALENIGFASIDAELRSRALAAMAAQGGAAVELNEVILLQMAKRRPFTAAERAMVERVPGGGAVVKKPTTSGS